MLNQRTDHNITVDGFIRIAKGVSKIVSLEDFIIEIGYR
jgi:hypothetical protein